MTNRYKNMTDDDFDRILQDIVADMTAGEILDFGDVNAILREELNNQVLDRWEEENLTESD